MLIRRWLVCESGREAVRKRTFYYYITSPANLMLESPEVRIANSRSTVTILSCDKEYQV